MLNTVYPDWPRSKKDQVPLPMCDGPKLEPFNFLGPQKIEFLEYIGQGLHAHVVKVRIRKQIYALKLFRFCYDENWLSPAQVIGPKDQAVMSAFYNYGEPFSCECRAFGRLKEAGHEDLAIGCFGYVLLDKKHERKLFSQFADLNLEFNGDVECPGGEDMRGRFLGRNGRQPPIRGIVKEYAYAPEEDELQEADMKKMLNDVKMLQQLGIIRIDVAARQVVGGRISDFSTAITVPHFLTTPELNPLLTPKMRVAMEFETFQLSKDDYLAFDAMTWDWNLEHAEKKGAITVCAFPGRGGTPQLRSYDLRTKTGRERVYTYVDPRRYDWKRRPRKGIEKQRRSLCVKPPMWIYRYGGCEYLTNSLRSVCVSTPNLDWEYRDGFIFPQV